MRIISKFKDYYDFIAKQYGREDSLVYHRTRIGPWDKEKSVVRDLTIEINEHLRDKLYLIRMEDTYFHNILSIAGIPYHLIYRKTIDEPKLNFGLVLFDPMKHSKFVSRYAFNYQTGNKFDSLTKVLGENKILIDISKKIGHPVFLIKEVYFDHSIQKTKITIQGNCPVLSDFGIPAIVSPQQMYQNLDYFIGNTIHDNPDIIPPVVIEEKYRYIEHGFDPIKSFRNMK